MLKRRSIIFALMLEVVFVSSVSGEDDASVESLLASLARYTHVKITGSATVLTRSDKLIQEGKSDVKSESSHGKLAIDYRRRKEQALLHWSREMSRDGDIRRYGMEYLLQDGELLYIQSRLGSAFEQESADSLVATYAAERLAGPEQRKSAQEVIEALGDSSLMFGYIGYFPLTDYLGNDAVIKTKMVETTGEPPHTLVNITADSPLGNLQLRLDPAFDFLPTSIQLEKTGSHPTSGKRTIQEIVMNGSEETWPDGKVKKIVWSVKDIKLVSGPTGCYIEGATVSQAVHTEAGPVVETVSSIKVRECVYSPDLKEKDFDTKLKIPTGFPVTAEGAEHLPFEWDGKAVVPAVTDHIPSFPKPVGNSSWNVLIIANVLLLALIAFFFFWKNRSRNS